MGCRSSTILLESAVLVWADTIGSAKVKTAARFRLQWSTPRNLGTRLRSPDFLLIGVNMEDEVLQIEKSMSPFNAVLDRQFAVTVVLEARFYEDATRYSVSLKVLIWILTQKAIHLHSLAL
jgi:hypothetical protein